MQSSNQTIDLLLDFFQRNPRDYTYFAVGSGPRTIQLEAFIPELDQIFPSFLREYISFNEDTIRIVHYDSVFNKKEVINFLNIYFKKLGFNYDDSDGFLSWKTPDHRIEVFVIGEDFDIPNELKHIQSMIKHYLDTNTKLVFQEYYGLSNGPSSLIQIHKQFYEATSQNFKEVYKQNILFDITYGEAHCMTNMAVEKPMLDDYGNFINFCILDKDEREKIIGINKKFDEIYRKIIIKKFKELIDYDQLEYRRSIINKLGEEVSSSIMNNLRLKMTPIISSLKKLNILNDDDKKQINQLFNDYKEIDMYKWPSEMKKIIMKKIE